MKNALPNSCSLIISTYNRPDALGMVLLSVSNQVLFPSEIIIADDGSDVFTKNLVEKWTGLIPCSITHVWQPDQGFQLAKIRNRAILVASGEYIISIDGDMLLNRYFIKDHIDLARRFQFLQGPRVWINESCTARILRNEKDVKNSDIKIGLSSIRCRALSRVRSSAKFSLNAIQGCNQSFWKSDLVEVNGFDERFNTWGGEDTELCARLINLGVKRNYIRNAAIAMHLAHPSRSCDMNLANQEILAETIRSRKTYCVDGLVKSPVFFSTAK